MVTLLIFIAVLVVLVLAHEFGHFIAARKNGIGVYEFGIGFPPRAFGIQIVKKKIKNEDGGKKNIRRFYFIRGNRALTEEDESRGVVYSINWIPLGGFVKIKGENGDNKDKDSFVIQKTWKKAIVLVAGVLMNILLAAVLFSVGYMIGLPTLTDQMKNVDNVHDRHLQIMQVLPDSPADKAELKADDVILKIGNIENPRLKAMQVYVGIHKDENVIIKILRGDDTILKNMTPMIYESGQAGIGVSIAEFGTVRYPWYSAIWHGFIDSFKYLGAIFAVFYDLIIGLFTGGSDAAESVSGPVGIAIMAGQVAKMGFIYLLQFTAILSLNLAVLNILPIPALDGGRLLFLFLNKIKIVNFAKYEQVVHSIGFLLLMILVVVVTVRDVGNFGGVFLDFFKNIF